MYDVIIMFIFKVYEAAVNLNQLHQHELLQHITHISHEAIIYKYFRAFCDWTFCDHYFYILQVHCELSCHIS